MATALIVTHIVIVALQRVLGIGEFYGILPFFDLNLEMNLPTLFNTLLFVGAGLLLHLIGAIRRKNSTTYRVWTIPKGPPLN